MRGTGGKSLNDANYSRKQYDSDLGELTMQGVESTFLNVRE